MPHTLKGRVTEVHERPAAGFWLDSNGQPVYCLVHDPAIDLPEWSDEVQVQGNWSPAVKGYFDVRQLVITRSMQEGE